eukprot:Rhum_TRINITY_DN25322_c0_g1::Rhum_TRINITY_DN25322_c0_g1_i1::g.181823::m.181823
MKDQEVISANRGNIPAVCRIPDRGTGFLVAPGLIMTGLDVVRSRAEAAKMQAVFFEGGKQAPVSVDLKPYKTFFVSAFPEHLSYALVACDTRGIRSVLPVQLPMTEKAWESELQEGDLALIVAHPLPRTAGRTPADDAAPTTDSERNEAAAAAAASAAAAPQPPSPKQLLALRPEREVKMFEEVAGTRDGLLLFKTNPSFNCAGCPVFNSEGTLAGIHSQLVRGGDTTSAHAVSIREVVRHLFANGKLGLFEAAASPAELWSTWGSSHDVGRSLRVLHNFQQTEIVQAAVEDLCV